MTTDFIKVRAHLNRGLSYDAQGKFAQSFKDLLYEEDENFRSKIIVPINEAVGLHNWATDFVENPGVGFLVDIYADNREEAIKIKSIIQERVADIDFEFFYKGDIDKYLSDE